MRGSKRVRPKDRLPLRSWVSRGIQRDAVALDVLEVFESMVRDALGGYEPPNKWTGEEAMLSLPFPETAIQVFGEPVQGQAVPGSWSGRTAASRVAGCRRDSTSSERRSLISS